MWRSLAPGGGDVRTLTVMTPRARPRVWRPVPGKPSQIPMHYEEALARKRAHYDAYDVAAFEQRLAAFERLDLRDPGLDLVKAVDRVVRDPVSGVAVFSMSWDEMPVGTLLWRARRMSAELLREGRVRVGDLWEPPAAHAAAGRFNHAGEPVLYACLETPLEALKEARIAEPGSGFILIGYEVLEPIPLRRVGVANPDEGLEPLHQALEERMSQFLAEVLSYPAAEYGTEVYAHTRRLLRKFYPLEPGWECGVRAPTSSRTVGTSRSSRSDLPSRPREEVRPRGGLLRANRTRTHSIKDPALGG